MYEYIFIYKTNWCCPLIAIEHKQNLFSPVLRFPRYGAIKIEIENFAVCSRNLGSW